jgi:hypothetical protein
MTGTIVYWHAQNQRKLEIAFPSVSEWNDRQQSERIHGRLRGHQSLQEVSVTAYLLLAAENRSVRRDLLVYRTLQFDEEMTTYEFLIQYLPILYMGFYDCIGQCRSQHPVYVG